jgi:hypothetical protein
MERHEILEAMSELKLPAKALPGAMRSILSSPA